MKKLIFVPMIAVAALGLTACKKDVPAPGNDTVITNDLTVNSEDANATAIDDAPLNNTTIDNATAIDNASNATTK